MGRRLRRQHIVAIQPGPKGLEGRAGDVRIRSGSFDIMAISGYPPPLCETGAAMKAQMKSISMTMCYIQQRISSAPSRCTPI
eukprot:4324394-Pyramimonas_sp.AAC.1